MLYRLRRAYRRIKQKLAIRKAGSCAGLHTADDIGTGPTWARLNPLEPESAADRLGWSPTVCTLCGEIYSMEWVGYTRELELERRRDWDAMWGLDDECH